MLEYRDIKMNILIFGAGAIGSLFGSILSKNNNVTLIGRKSHVNAIKKHGLKIEGKTTSKSKIIAETSVNKIDSAIDLLILTVKSYDTEKAISQAKKIINDNTIVLSIQNGLDNIDIIKKYVNSKNIIAGTTTYGAYFYKPGIIKHTGIGLTILGELNSKNTERIKKIYNKFKSAGIKTIVCKDIIKEIWIKAIINSSINPLSTYFQCKNGYLLKNPILEKLVERICIESTNIAIANKIDVSVEDMINKTKEVIRGTSDNYSSMLQSFKKGKNIEIVSINGKFVDYGKKYKKDKTINKVLIDSLRTLK